MDRTPTFNARVAMDQVTPEGRVVLEPRAARPQNRHQVFGPGENEDIGRLGIAIPRQPLSVLRVMAGMEWAQSKPEGSLPPPES